MHIVISTATQLEVEPIKKRIARLIFAKPGDVKLSYHLSGVGMLAATYHLTKIIQQQKPDFFIQAGIAGTFNQKMELGSVVVIKDECLGDMGVEENGVFADIFDMNLSDKEELPFNNKKLINPWLSTLNHLQLPAVSGVTVNEISTRTQRIDQLKNKYQPVIESMEGAALHFVALQENVPFLQVRSVSNYVGERDKSKWKIREALETLSEAVTNLVEEIAQQKQNLFQVD